MSIQDDVKYVKSELSGDEKILESAFKLETLYKKYKLLIWGAAAAVLLFFVGTTAMEAIRDARLADANNAFLTLQKKPDDASALKTLKEKNPELFELFTFSQAAKKQNVAALKALTSSKNEVLADSSRYVTATLEKKETESKLYKEMAELNAAYLALKAGNISHAKEKLELIDERSAVAPIATLLKHATLKAK
ncbi:hypothetical protein YH65_09120 [Sulfurovum lithotrophicum]|uniref:Tetratricopeptide repeat-like domain-containing protein n=1 Tax=Sulfurovum lithotrophicum TaxID=206403 RepID=A0A7U4M277_9BACT|nr:hypothetical protein [Sulfurovum lithotrophicum]AKF25516.1 hypothetical protein YH65_09120 [Sulfurovum lithotrophicum]